MQQPQEKKELTVRSLMNDGSVRSKIEELFGEKDKDSQPKTTAFVISVINTVNKNEMLKDADPKSLLSAVMTSATMQLPINENLGFAYIVPYKSKGSTLAQLQIGWKGFVQLAERSGQFKTISASPIYENQIVSKDPLKGYVFSFEKKPEGKIAGYAGYFQLINGFEKTLYMTTEELEKHGKRYSQSYKKGYGVWQDNFDSMAMKTVLKLLLSKYAPLSIEMQTAIVEDQKVDEEYLDNKKPTLQENDELEQYARVSEWIETCETSEDLEEIKEMVYATKDKDLIQAFETKYNPLKKEDEKKEKK